MKGRNSGNNGSDLDKGNIIKPTFDTLTEEGRKAFEAYYANLEVTPEVWPEPSPSRNDMQSMINSALEKQAKSTDGLLRRLIDEWDGIKHNGSNVKYSSTSTVSFPQINPHTSGPSVGSTSILNPFAQPVNHQ
jgi:hypothetical protein